MELKRDNASPPVLLNDVNEADNNVASFIISADDLDLFASEQMRKTSISQGKHILCNTQACIMQNTSIYYAIYRHIL